jgi:hypothetical protein
LENEARSNQKGFFLDSGFVFAMSVGFADVRYIVDHVEGSISFGALDWSVNEKVILYGITLFLIYSLLGEVR